jgi:hypothetical protein
MLSGCLIVHFKERAAARKTVYVVAPILPGKAEAWRRFMQEMLGSRRGEYEEARRRLGLRLEQAWISETRQVASGVVVIEADSLARGLADFLASTHPFDRWLREQLLVLHGLDLTPPVSTFRPELVFAR